MSSEAMHALSTGVPLAGLLGVVMLRAEEHQAPVSEADAAWSWSPIEPLAGTVRWDSIVTMGPDWNAMEYETEWLGI